MLVNASQKLDKRRLAAKRMKSGFQSQKNRHSSVDRQELGRRGEDVAAAFFRAQGFSVLSRNWRCRLGEIDLIVGRGQEIRFIEVKMRKTHAFGYPEASVTPKKLAHLQAAMEIWLRLQTVPPKMYQVDVLAISLLHPNKPPEVVWIQGV